MLRKSETAIHFSREKQRNSLLSFAEYYTIEKTNLEFKQMNTAGRKYMSMKEDN